MLNEDSVIKILFDRKEYIEYEVPNEGIMFYSEKDEKTYFLNSMAITILEFANEMKISEIISYIEENFEVKEIEKNELFEDIKEICIILSENKFIEILN